MGKTGRYKHTVLGGVDVACSGCEGTVGGLVWVFCKGRRLKYDLKFDLKYDLKLKVAVKVTLGRGSGVDDIERVHGDLTAGVKQALHLRSPEIKHSVNVSVYRHRHRHLHLPFTFVPLHSAWQPL